MEIERFEVKAKKYQGKANELREKLKTIFPKLETDKFVVDDGQNKVLKAQLIDGSSVVYNKDFLKANLPKEVYRKILKISLDNGLVDKIYKQGLIPFKILKKSASLRSSIRLVIQRVAKEQQVDKNIK